MQTIPLSSDEATCYVFRLTRNYQNIFLSISLEMPKLGIGLLVTWWIDGRLAVFTAPLTISVISSQRKADYERLYVVEHCLRLNEIPVPVRFKSRLLAIAGQDWIYLAIGAPSFNELKLLHSERPKLYTVLAFLSAIGLRTTMIVLRRSFKSSFIYRKTLNIGTPRPATVVVLNIKQF